MLSVATRARERELDLGAVTYYRNRKQQAKDFDKKVYESDNKEGCLIKSLLRNVSCNITLT